MMAPLISALAYLALVPLLAGGPDLARSLRRPGLFPGLAGPLAGCLFIPNGSLPPFLDFAWSGEAFCLGLLLGPLVRTLRGRGFQGPAFRRPDQAPGLETLLQLLLILIPAWLFLCLYALRRGLPGDLPGLSVFAATPLLTQAGPAAGLGLICLFAALSPLAARPEAARPHPARIMTRFSISAFLIAVFFPFSLSALIGPSGPLGLDFFLFWGQVILLNRVIAPRLARVSPRARAFLAAAGLFALSPFGPEL